MRAARRLAQAPDRDRRILASQRGALPTRPRGLWVRRPRRRLAALGSGGVVSLMNGPVWTHAGRQPVQRQPDSDLRTRRRPVDPVARFPGLGPGLVCLELRVCLEALGAWSRSPRAQLLTPVSQPATDSLSTARSSSTGLPSHRAWCLRRRGSRGCRASRHRGRRPGSCGRHGQSPAVRRRDR